MDVRFLVKDNIQNMSGD